jgi:NADP-dependent 3-hydroxy acid dehydrogenase YdfG
MTKQKTAIVTGGTTGLGKAITKTFIDAGIFTIIIDLSRENLDAAKEEFGDKCGYELFNLANLDKIPALVYSLE